MHEFKLAKTLATLTNANPRKEIHGEDAVDAIDLDFSLKGGPELLDLIIEETTILKSALWDSEQGAHMEVPGLTELKFGLSFENHEVVIHTTRNKSIKLKPATVKKFKFVPGSVGDPSFLKFQGQGNPDEIEIGKLCHLQTAVVEVEIQPAQQSLPLTDSQEGK